MLALSLEAAGEDAVGQAGEVEVVDLVAVLADDLADQAVARGPRAACAVASIRNLRDSGHRAERALAAVRHVEAGRAELPEGVPVLVGQPEQLADHQERDGNANVATRSTRRVGGRLPLELVELASTIAAIRGRSRSSRRIVNSGVSSRRSRVWSRRVGETEPADVAVGGRAALAHERPDVGAVAAWCPRAPRAPRRHRSRPRRSCRGTR